MVIHQWPVVLNLQVTVSLQVLLLHQVTWTHKACALSALLMVILKMPSKAAVQQPPGEADSMLLTQDVFHGQPIPAAGILAQDSVAKHGQLVGSAIPYSYSEPPVAQHFRAMLVMHM